MRIGGALIVLALTLAGGCNQQGADSKQAGQAAPQLDAPAPDSEPVRVFAPTSDSARSTTGQLTVSIAMQLPDANEPGADSQETLSLQGANGLAAQGVITGAVSTATQVQGQALRALLTLPPEEQQALVYRVTNETKPATGQGLCGADATAFVVVWEPSGPGDPVMKVMGVSGGAPGAASARACPMLEYLRS